MHRFRQTVRRPTVGSEAQKKCPLLASNPELGDDRSELGERIRNAYVGSYVIYFRHLGSFVEIVLVIRGDRDIRFL